VFLGRDGELINKTVREPQTTTTDADVYRSAGGTSVVAESDFVAYDERGHELWRKSRSGREPIYLSADGSTFARITRDWAGLALVAYDRSGATVARIGITDSYLAGPAIPPFLLTTDFGTMKIDSFYPVKVRLSEHGQFAALYGGHTATLVSITGRKVLWQAAFRDSSEAGGPEILDVRPNAMLIAFTSFHGNLMVCSVHMLVDGRDLDEPIRLRRKPDSLWQCTAAGDFLVVRQGERFRVYALWR
jgi:hypothetical protein